jgi:hypothetical protein
MPWLDEITLRVFRGLLPFMLIAGMFVAIYLANNPPRGKR